MKRFDIGFDIGGTNIAAGLYDESHALCARADEPFPLGEDARGVASMLFLMAGTLLKKAGAGKAQLDSVGIAVPGSIDPHGRIVIDAHNIGFHDAPLYDAVKAAFGMDEVYLANDANAAALAEFRKGALRGCYTGALITLGTGVGGGLIMGGKLFKGGRGSGVELGHMILANGEDTCSCGNRGCAEAVCSAGWLIKQGRENFVGMIEERARGRKEDVTAKLVIDCAKSGDGMAQGIFARYVDALGSAVASLINLLDPEVIAIGGGVSLAGDFLFKPLIENAHGKSFFREHGAIVPAQLGNDAGMLGAALFKTAR